MGCINLLLNCPSVVLRNWYTLVPKLCVKWSLGYMSVNHNKWSQNYVLCITCVMICQLMESVGQGHVAHKDMPPNSTMFVWIKFSWFLPDSHQPELPNWLSVPHVILFNLIEIMKHDTLQNAWKYCNVSTSGSTLTNIIPNKLHIISFFMFTLSCVMTSNTANKLCRLHYGG